MIDHSSTLAGPAWRVASLYLDYGADAQDCDKDAVEFSELGMQVRSRWQFPIGTQLCLDFVRECGRCTAEVTVVGCEPAAEEPGAYRCTLLFDHFPEELRPALVAR